MSTTAADKLPCFLRSERSPAFATYCERVYGRMLNQYGTADMPQLELLVSLLPAGKDARILDAGCGTGHTTCYLAARTGARFLGIDKSDASIRRARELASSPFDSRDRPLAQGAPDLTFEVMDMDALDLPPAALDAVVAIESLYFPKDLSATIGAFRKAVRPGGLMALFFTSFGEASAAADPGATKLGTALSANGLSFDVHDLTERDRRFWALSKETAEAMKAEFEAEGNADLLHLGETDAVLGLIGKGGHARYLYQVRL